MLMSLYNEISRRYEAQLHIISVLFKLSRAAINSQQMIKHFPPPFGNIKLMMKQSCCIFANTYQQERSGTCKNRVACVSQNGGFWKKNLSQVCHKILAIFIWLICFDPSNFKVTFHSSPRLKKRSGVS